MHYFKPVDNLVEKGMISNFYQCPKTDKEKEKTRDVSYASVVGNLMYAILCRRADVCFVLAW